MNYTFTTRAKIALEQLNRQERKRADHFLSRLAAATRLSELQDKVYKLPTIRGEEIFVGRIGMRYRAILRPDNDIIEILEIVDHDRFSQIYRLGGLR